MNTNRLWLLIAVSGCAVTAAQDQMSKTEHGIPDAPTHLTNTATTDTGSILKKELKWKSNIPLDKTYEQLTPEQRAEFRAPYEKLGESDEPPFPAQGLKPIFNALRRGQHTLQARGDLDLLVTVGADGNATKVEDFGSVNGPNAYEMTNYAAAVFMKAKYKPAVCNGKPCIMQFPFKLALN
jgi:hypothetical protein